MRTASFLAAGVVSLAVLIAPSRAPQAAVRPEFATLAGSVADRTIQDRRWLHEHPELPLREHGTQRYLRERLLEIPGVEMIEGDWGTGLVALIRGGRPGSLVAYRADIDALPLVEATGLTFASSIHDTLDGRDVGVMHACGHDLHASILLGTARVLAAVRDSLPGSVIFVLEPAEEVGAGARQMLDSGLFEGGRKPSAIFAIHDHPTLLYGQVGYCPGWSAANVDEFRIRVLGKGGHGAYPHKAIDPVVIASQLVVALQSVVSRQLDAARQAVITVGSIHGGSTSNVIPDFVDLAGTVRTLEPDVRAQAREAVLRTARGIAAAAGAPEPEIEYILGTPSLYNDPALVDELLPVFDRVVGAANVIRYEPGMGGEDFSFFREAAPGIMFRLGVGRPDREMNIHSASFDPDERAVPLGVRLMSEILWDALARRSAR